MTQQLSDDFIGQRTRRIQNTEALKKLGINPYPSQSRKDFPNKKIVDEFENFQGKEVTLAGRMMAKREHGKILFGVLQDQSGTIQFAIRQNELEENLEQSFLGWEHITFLDIGDYIQIAGTIDTSSQGEITLFVKHIILLAKTLRPLPHSFDDKEMIFRKRYLDLTINPKRMDVFMRKAHFWEANRAFMKQHGFMEVETPVLELVTGGADARPFITHHHDLDQDFYLRISTELYQKRLIGGGFEKIFTIGPNFRNEGLSDEHLQEYYQIEWYWAYADYRDNMKMLVDMFRYIAKEVYGKTTFTTRGHTFDLTDEWKEVDYVNIIKERFGVDIFNDSDEHMLEVLKKEGVDLPGTINRNRLIDNLWKLIRKTIPGPAFLVNEPAFMSPLAKTKERDPRLTERFHIVIAGSELGNGYSEINDPQYQLEQFLAQQRMRDEGDDEAQMLDIDYVEMLEYGMPPTSGYAHSERLFWFLEDVSAREGTLFPQLRRVVDPLTKEIYKDLVSPSSQTMKRRPTPPAEKNNFDQSKLPTREQAQELLEKHVGDDYQRKHAVMVARAMEACAKHFGEDPELWYITGLLHDLDYFKHPDEHPNESLKWFAEWEYPQVLIDAISAHAHGSGRTDTPPRTRIDFALIACDELCGLLYAYSLMRPEGFKDMKAKSAMKKFKDKAFAAKIDREEIRSGVEGLGIELKDHIKRLIDIFQE
ncbi:lysine--tRNA ligase [Candidatus Woesebacteria bacterium]|nr:lysine--tRNA ligase [Candidatus Woesebacteria bacterium]